MPGGQNRKEAYALGSDWAERRSRRFGTLVRESLGNAGKGAHQKDAGAMSGQSADCCESSWHQSNHSLETAPVCRLVSLAMVPESRARRNQQNLQIHLQIHCQIQRSTQLISS